MSKLLGPVLIVVGLLFLLLAYVSWDDVRVGISGEAKSMPRWWTFWIPHSYNVVTLPEYAITYLVIGTMALTAGTILSVQEIRKNHKYAAANQTLKER